MGANLTYHLRSDVIAGTLAGQHFFLPTYREDSGMWAQVEGLNLEWEVIGYGEGSGSRIGTSLGHQTHTLPTARSAVTCSHFMAQKGVALVDARDGGLIIHGWPPCGGRRCIVVTHGWEELLTALAREGDGSIRFES